MKLFFCFFVPATLISIYMRPAGHSQILCLFHSWISSIESSRIKEVFWLLSCLYRFIATQSSNWSLNRLSKRQIEYFPIYTIYIFHRVFIIFAMFQHNENQPPPMGQIRNTVTTSRALPVNAQIKSGIDTIKILELLLSRTNTREKTMAENSAGKRPHSPVRCVIRLWVSVPL